MQRVTRLNELTGRVAAIALGLALAGCVGGEIEEGIDGYGEVAASLGGHSHHDHGPHGLLRPSGDPSGLTDYNNLMEALNGEPVGATAYIRCGMVDRPVGGLSGEVLLEDGDTVTLEDADGRTGTFEFDSDGAVSDGHVAVPLTGTDAREVADVLASTINAYAHAPGYPQGLRIDAQALYGDAANPGFFMANVLLRQTVPGPAGNGRIVAVDAADPWFDGQSTFEGGATGQGGRRVRLGAGTFRIARSLKVEGFDGGLRGAGAERTSIETVIEDPAKTVGGGFGYAYDPFWGAGGYFMGAGHLLFSFPHNVTVEGLALRVPENERDGGYYGPADWEFYDGATGLNSFALMVAGNRAGERPRVVIRDVTAVGGRGDAWAGVGPEDAVNMPYGFFAGFGTGIDLSVPGQGSIRYERSAVDNGPWRGFVIANLDETSTGVIRDCTVRNGGDGLRLVEVHGADVRLDHNTIELNRGFPPVWWQGALTLVRASGVRARHNTISGRSAIPLVQSDDNVFEHNTFEDLDPDFLFYGGPRAAFVVYSGSDGNVFEANRYRHSGLLGFTDATNPAGALFLAAGTSGNIVREHQHWPAGTNVCDMVQDLTDDPSTADNDGANSILFWDRFCGD